MPQRHAAAPVARGVSSSDVYTRYRVTVAGAMRVASLAAVCLAAAIAPLPRAEEELKVESAPAAGSASGGSAAAPTQVIEVIAPTFDKLLKKEALALIEVYSPDCYHCQQLEPAYAHAASVLAGEAVPIPLARINIDTQKDFVEQKFPNIDGTPLLVVLREGREVERLKYGGKTGAEEGEKIVTAMRELALAPFGSNEVKELSELSDLRVGRGLQGAIVVSKPIGEAMVVAILQPQPEEAEAEGESEAQAGGDATASQPVTALFSSVTRSLKQKIGFAHSYEPDIREALKVTKPNMLLLLEAPYLSAAAPGEKSLLASIDLDEVRKTPFLEPLLLLKTIILPRQIRDKRKGNSKKEAFFAGHRNAHRRQRG